MALLNPEPGILSYHLCFVKRGPPYKSNLEQAYVLNNDRETPMGLERSSVMHSEHLEGYLVLELLVNQR